MPNVSDTHYTCDNCGGTFPKGWSDEEANAETKQLFGVDGASDKIGPDDEDMAVVCDDCFQAMSQAGFIPHGQA